MTDAPLNIDDDEPQPDSFETAQAVTKRNRLEAIVR